MSRCSTWNMRFFLLLFLVFSVASCQRPDAQPELKDSIYLDIQTELGLATKNKEEAKKTLEEHQTNLDRVVPQTGQIRYAQKRVWDAKKVIAQFEQQEKYWSIRLEQRLMYVRKKSLEAFHKGQVWTDSQELSEYQTEKRLRQARNQWDSRQRREDFLKAEADSAKAASAAAAGEGGGGQEAPAGGH